MAKNKKIMKLLSCRMRFKSLSYAGLLCSVALLSACGGDNSPQIPAFVKKQQAQETLKNSTSHMNSEMLSEAASTDPINLEAAAKPEVKIPPKTIARTRLNPKNLFGKDLRTNEERLDRLERAVQDMRQEFDAVTPSIKRLMAVEGDIQELIVELKKLRDDPSMAETPTKRRPAAIPQVTSIRQDQRPDPVVIKPVKKTTKPKPIQRKTAPPVQNGKASVYDIRVGEHPGKTRIVLDVNTKTSFKTDIDNGEKIMIVELPEASWDTAASRNFGKSPFISSYKVESSNDGQLLIFQLKREAKISYKADIGGTSGTSRRIVIDLSGA